MLVNAHILSNEVPLVSLFCFQLNVHILFWHHSSHQMTKQSGSAWLVCAFLIEWLINKQGHVCLPTCTIQASRTVIVKSCGNPVFLWRLLFIFVQCISLTALQHLIFWISYMSIPLPFMSVFCSSDLGRFSGLYRSRDGSSQQLWLWPWEWCFLISPKMEWIAIMFNKPTKHQRASICQHTQGNYCQTVDAERVCLL